MRSSVQTGGRAGSVSEVQQERSGVPWWKWAIAERCRHRASLWTCSRSIGDDDDDDDEEEEEEEEEDEEDEVSS